MKLALLVAAAVGTWLVLRRRRVVAHRVVVGWADGSELELRPGTPESERLVEIAEGVLLR